MRLDVRRNVATGLRAFRFSGVGGQGSGVGSYAGFNGQTLGALVGGTLPGSQVDFKRKAGNLWDSGLIRSCLKWQARVVPQARQVVRRENADGEWENVPKHPALGVLRNPYYSAVNMMDGVRLSYQVDGNAYFYKLRNGFGVPIGLLYVPHVQIEPRWPKDGSEWISHYEYKVDGKVQPPIPPKDIIHVKDGIDPLNPRKGLSALGAVLREVCTDHEALTFNYSILANMGIPGVVISPDVKDSALASGVSEGFTQEQQEAAKTLWARKFTGDQRGEPLVSSMPMKVQFVAFSPEQLGLDHMLDIPEERVTAALGIPAIIVGFGTGLEQATLNNAEAMERWAWTHNVIPTLEAIDQQVTEQLMDEIPGAVEGDEFGRDYSKVRALQEDANAKSDRESKAVGGKAYFTVNEVRALNNLPALAGHDEIPTEPVVDPNADPKDGDKPEDG